MRELIRRVNEGTDYYIRALSTDADQTSSYGVTGEPALVKKEWYRPWAWLRVARTFAKADRVVVSGGTPIFDSSHLIRALYLGLPLVFGTPVVVFGAGVKPLQSRWGRRSVPFFLKKAAYVSVRDEDSRRILNELGIEGVQLTADSAFFAMPGDQEALQGLLD